MYPISHQLSSKSRLIFKYKWLSSTIIIRSFFTGIPRKTGYVSYFHPDNQFGFICTDEVPDKEYYFNASDLHVESIPRVRPLQTVQFGVVESKGGNDTARDITAADGSLLKYNHANLELDRESRNLKLSALPNGLIDRHTGVQITHHSNGEGGYIIPDKLNYGTVQYRDIEIQATCSQKLDKLSEVEFYVRPAKNENQMDSAICITRKGGGLITSERQETGSRLRVLGCMYNINDIKARIPQEFQNNRQLGYVLKYEYEKHYAFILPFNDPTNTIFVHLDDCHIFGPRYLNRFQCLEYVQISDQNTGKIKAVHVTGAQQTVLKSRSPNRYKIAQECIHDLPVGTDERFIGHITNARKGVNFFLIKPEKADYKTLVAFKNNMRVLGSRMMQVGDAVEFEVISPYVKSTEEESNDSEHRHLNRAINISAPDNRPLLVDFGPYGNYLQSKFNLTTVQSEFEECEPSLNQNGYICTYSSERRIGTIEIEAPVGVRYKKVLFHWNDCLVNNDLDANKLHLPRIGSKIQCRIENISEDDHLYEYEKVDDAYVRTVHRKAGSIVSHGQNVLNVREILNPIENRNKKREGNEEIDDLHFLRK